MKLLLVEDRVTTLVDIYNALKDKYDVCKATSIKKAQEVLLRNEITTEPDNRIRAIITDLNMSCEGLTDEQIRESEGAQLAGWQWVINYVFCDEKNQDIHLLLCSDFLDILEKRIERLKNTSMVNGQNEINIFERAIRFPKNETIFDDHKLLDTLDSLNIKN
jgi:hypothetical protein